MYNSGVGSGGSNAPDQFGGQRCTRARTFVVSAAARSFCEQLEIVAGEQRGPYSAGPHALVGWLKSGSRSSCLHIPTCANGLRLLCPTQWLAEADGNAEHRACEAVGGVFWRRMGNSVTNTLRRRMCALSRSYISLRVRVPIFAESDMMIGAGRSKHCLATTPLPLGSAGALGGLRVRQTSD